MPVSSVRPLVLVSGLSARMVVVVNMDVHLGRPEGALHDLSTLERKPFEIELGELVPERLEGRARVDQGAHDHVACGPARAVEVRDAHGYLILAASLLIWFACAAAP
jgi:hypothetical protein